MFANGNRLSTGEMEALFNFLNQPMVMDVPTLDGHSRSMIFGDGGFNDANGVPALVHKKVRKIISVHFITGHPAIFDLSPIDAVLEDWASVAHFFGLILDSMQSRLSNPYSDEAFFRSVQ